MALHEILSEDKVRLQVVEDDCVKWEAMTVERDLVVDDSRNSKVSAVRVEDDGDVAGIRDVEL